MKKIATVVALAFCFLSLNAQCDYYYWYQNKKICLEKYNKMRFILVDNEEDTFIVKEKLEKLGFIVSGFKKTYSNYNPYHAESVKEKYWAFIECSDSDAQTSLSVSEITYEGSFFRYSGKISLALSHTFSVRLHTLADTISLSNISKTYGVTILGNSEIIPLSFMLSCSKTSAGNAMEMANLFHESGLFKWAQPNLIDFDIFNKDMAYYPYKGKNLNNEEQFNKGFNIPICSSEPYFDDQWGLRNIGQYGGTPGIDIKYCLAKDITKGHSDIVVAVIDEGVELDHPDLTNMHPFSYDTETGTSPSQLCFGFHGTACAGIIGANANNGKGIAGIAPASPIMSISDWLSNSDIAWQNRAKGIRKAVDNGASVLSNSWFNSMYSGEIDDAIDYALTYGRGGKGCVVIFISCNWDSFGMMPPGTSPKVITVGSISPCGERTTYNSCGDTTTGFSSQYGEFLDIMAPGIYIPTTDRQGNEGYNSEPYCSNDYLDKDYTRFFGGTSAAVPHVAGVAALVLSVNPNLTGQQVRNILESTAQKIRTDLYDYNYDNIDIHPNGTWNEEMGHGLVDAYAAVLKALEGTCYNPSSKLPVVAGTVSKNTTWNTPVFASSNIIVKSGVTLTITDDVFCDKNASITIAPGGKLILNGGTLTNACQNQLWQGITVMGDPTKPMTKSNQGYLEITNGGKIENAVTGVTVQGGGMVETENAKFVNNTTGVKFESLAPGQPYGRSGFFDRTDFDLTPGYFGNSAFETHINAQSSGRIVTTGCKFSSTAPQNSGKNFGILSFNTSLVVREYCSFITTADGSCADNNKIRGEFSGFYRAISAGNSGANPALKICYNDFTGNLTGIYVNGMNNHELYRNKFFLTSAYAEGVSVNNATGYKIEENTFRNSYNDPLTNQTVGLTINNSGGAENEVYKNEFNELYAGQNFLCNNATVIGNGSFPGLQTLCNKFNHNQYRDIHVGNLGSRTVCTEHFIRGSQGSLQKPAGNQFYGTPTVNIDNSKSQFSINYYCRNVNNEYPPIVANVSRIPIAFVNTCPSKIDIINPGGPGGGKEESEALLAQYDEWNEQYEYWLARAMEVCGDENSYALTVLRSYGLENEECFNLLDKVSYYSALKDNYFNWIIVSVMDNYELRITNYEMEKAESDDKDSYGLTVLRSYGLLRDLFAHRGQYGDYLSITETWLAENNYCEAWLTLAKMHDQFKVTEEQFSELKGLEIYTHWLQQLEEAQNSIYTLSEKEINYLINYVETNTGRGVVFVNNILCELYGICPEDEGIKAEEQKGRNAESDDENSYGLMVLRSYGLEIFPNPGKDYITVTSEIEHCHFELIDAIGTVQKSLKLHQGSNNINTLSLKQGIYIYRVITGNRVFTGKWIKM